MANRSVIDIDVNDEAFQKFKSAFQAYAKELDKQPQKWQKLDEALNATASKFAEHSKDAESDLSGSANVASTLKDELHKATKSQDHFTRATQKASKAFKTLGHSAGHVRKTLAHIAKFTGAIGGLSMGASLFALPDIAHSAMKQGQHARSLGISTGKMNAFDVNTQSLFTNPHHYLQSIAEAKNNPSQAVGLMNLLGKSDQQVANTNTVKLASEAAKKMHSFANDHNRAFLKQYLEANRLNSIFSVGEARLLGNTSKQRINENLNRANSKQQAQQLGFSRNSGAQMARFSIAVHKAGQEIENDLIRRLSSLGGSLSQLSQSVAKAITTLVNNVLTQGNMKALAHGIHNFAQFISSKKFIGDLHQFGSAISTVSSAILAAAHKLGWLTKGPGSDIKEGAAAAGGLALFSKGPLGKVSREGFKGVYKVGKGGARMAGSSSSELGARAGGEIGSKVGSKALGRTLGSVLGLSGELAGGLADMAYPGHLHGSTLGLQRKQQNDFWQKVDNSHPNRSLAFKGVSDHNQHKLNLHNHNSKHHSGSIAFQGNHNSKSANKVFSNEQNKQAKQKAFNKTLTKESDAVAHISTAHSHLPHKNQATPIAFQNTEATQPSAGYGPYPSLDTGGSSNLGFGADGSTGHSSPLWRLLGEVQGIRAAMTQQVGAPAHKTQSGNLAGNVARSAYAGSGG